MCSFQAKSSSKNTSVPEDKWAFTPDPGWKWPAAVTGGEELEESDTNIVRVLDFTQEGDDSLPLGTQHGEDMSETTRNVSHTPPPQPASNPDVIAETVNLADKDNQISEVEDDDEEGETKIKLEVDDSKSAHLKVKSNVGAGKKDVKSTSRKQSTTVKGSQQKVDPAAEKKKVVTKTDALKQTNAKNVTSRVGGITKKGLIAKTKDEIENADSNKNPKVSKNATNRKMSNSSLDKSATKATVEKLSKLSSPRDRKLSKGKLEISSSLRTVEVRPVIVQNQNGGGDKKQPPVKRNPPKSKWDNIMSQIDNNKEKPANPKSKLEAAKTSRPSSASKPQTSTGSTSSPATRKPNSGTTVANTLKGRITPRKTSVPARLVPPSKRTSPDVASRKSSASDISGADSSRNSSLPSPRSRPSSACK